MQQPDGEGMEAAILLEVEGLPVVGSDLESQVVQELDQMVAEL